jgi:uncharacterized protein YcbX
MYTISKLFIYPIKSLGGFEVSAAILTDRGFQYDRRWMLVDANNQFLTQREYPEMSLLQTAIENNGLVIFHKNNPTDRLILPLQPVAATTCKVKVWDDECDAQLLSDMADEWLSQKLAMRCRLVYMPDIERRKVDERYAQNNEITSFSDGYPILMIGQASVDDLNSRLTDPLPINRFRPNIVFTGGEPYEEDTMGHLVINGINMYGVKLCSRCVLTTINQTDGVKGLEPLKTLAGYRKAGNNIFFGQNILFKQTGRLMVGDSLEIIKYKPRILFDCQTGAAT